MSRPTAQRRQTGAALAHLGEGVFFLLRLYGPQGLSGESSFLRWALPFLTRFSLPDVVSMYLLLLRYVRVTLS